MVNVSFPQLSGSQLDSVRGVDGTTQGDTLLRPPIEPMRAAGVAELPDPQQCRGGCAYEPKFDGWLY